MLVFSLVFAATFAAAVPVALAVTVEIAPSSDGDRTVQIAAAERRNGHVGLRFDGTGALASILENATIRHPSWSVADAFQAATRILRGASSYRNGRKWRGRLWVRHVFCRL